MTIFLAVFLALAAVAMMVTDLARMDAEELRADAVRWNEEQR